MTVRFCLYICLANGNLTLKPIFRVPYHLCRSVRV